MNEIFALQKRENFIFLHAFLIARPNRENYEKVRLILYIVVHS